MKDLRIMKSISVDRSRKYRDLIDFRSWIDTDKGLLRLMWMYKFSVLLGITWYFIINRQLYVDRMSEIRVATLCFFIYLVALGISGSYNYSKFLSRKIKFLQIVFEITIYSVFYYLMGDFRSGAYLLYFLPLLVAVRYLKTWQVIIVLAFASLSLFVVVEGTAGFPVVSPFFEAYLPRELFLIGLTTFYRISRRSPVDIEEETSQLISTFKGFTDGVYAVDQEQRLLFVNDILQVKHGPYSHGQSCASYFICKDQVCGWCPVGVGINLGNPVREKREATFIDQEGHPYQVEIFFTPLPNEQGVSLGTVAFVKDVTARKEADRQLQEYSRKVERRVQSLMTERARWIDTFHDLGKGLTGPRNLKQLTQFIVEASIKRLNAESAAFFLLEDGYLVRKAIVPMDDSWFSEESYKVDQGVTGRTIMVENGVKYGRDILDNAVQDNPLVVSDYLIRYKDKLETHELKHLIAVPLNGQERPFGVLRVINKLDDKGNISDAGFTQDDVDFLGSIASMAAIAIENENVRILHETTQRLQELTTLYTVGKKLSQVLKFNDLSQIVVDEIRKAIPTADKVTLYLLDSSGATIDSKVISEPTILSSGQPPLRSDQGILGRALQKREMVYVEDTRRDPAFIDRGVKILSLLIVPLCIGDTLIGSLSVDSGQPNAFALEKQQLLKTLAAQAAIAIQNTRLYEEAQAGKQAAQANLEIIQSLYQASTSITSPYEDPRQVTDDIVQKVCEAVNAEGAAFLLVDENGQSEILAATGIGRILADNAPARPTGNSAQVATTGQPRFWTNSEATFEELHPEMISRKLQSAACLPLPILGRNVGVLWLDFLTPHHFSKSEQTALQFYANYAASAYDNVRRVREAEHIATLLKKLVETSRGLIEHTSLNVVYQFSADRCAGIFEVEDCSIFVLNDEQQTVDLVASSGIPSHLWKKWQSLFDGPGLTAYVARTGKTLNFEDEEYKDHEAWAGHYGSPFLAHLEYLPSKRCHSLLIVPLVNSEGRRIGVVKLENKLSEGIGKRFSEFEVAVLQTFASHIGIAIERARLDAARVARESLGDDLHDLKGFTHGTLVLGLAYVKQLLLREEYTAALDQIEEKSKAARNIQEALDRMLKDVRDPILQDKGLVQALNHYARMLDLDVQINWNWARSIPRDIEYALYKISREALNNVAKHAGHKEGCPAAVITASENVEGFELVIYDRGAGFDNIAVENRDDAFGIESMKRWTEYIGAKFELFSQPGMGTRIRVKGNINEVPQ